MLRRKRVETMAESRSAQTGLVATVHEGFLGHAQGGSPGYLGPDAATGWNYAILYKELSYKKSN